jgi:hypothetical protein
MPGAVIETSGMSLPNTPLSTAPAADEVMQWAHG